MMRSMLLAGLLVLPVGRLMATDDTPAAIAEREAAEEREKRINARLEDINELLDTKLEEEGIDTIGGLIFNRLGSVPRPGTQMKIDDLTLTVRRTSRKREDSSRSTPLPSDLISASRVLKKNSLNSPATTPLHPDACSLPSTTTSSPDVSRYTRSNPAGAFAR